MDCNGHDATGFYFVGIFIIRYLGILNIAIIFVVENN